MRSFLFFSSSIVALTGCGGNVVVDGAGGGTSTTTGTSASTSTTASTGTTTMTTTGTFVCPDPFPGIEASCQIEGQLCPVPLACCGGTAECTGGFWKFHAAPCGTICSQPCGPDEFACQGGAVCVAYIGKTTTYQCQGDPCPASGLSCSCAAPLCAQQSMVCDNIQDGFKVLCDCQGQC